MTDINADPLAKVTDDNGQVRLCKDKCTTCLFQPGRMVREVIDDARNRGSFVMCHETYANTGFVPADGIEPAMCRGYWDAYSEQQIGLKVLRSAHFHVEVPTPPPPVDQRHHVLIDARDGFHFRRADKDELAPSYTVWAGPPGQLEKIDSGEYDGEYDVIQDPAWELLGDTIAGGPGDSPWTVEVEVRVGDDAVRVQATLNYLEPHGEQQ